MSYPDVVSRVSELQQLAGLAPAASPTAEPQPDAEAFPAALAALVESGGDGESSAFGLPSADGLLNQLEYLPSFATAGSGGSAGSRVLEAAESQLGAAEQPPGSNDGPQLAVYRTAVAGAAPGEPWCAYFASWAAARAGEPLGDDGQGLGSVASIADWAGRTGRLLPPTATPTPGDLILFGDRHVGIVESVQPDGSLTTIEGNYANAVSRVHRSPAEATGYVAL